MVSLMEAQGEQINGPGSFWQTKVSQELSSGLLNSVSGTHLWLSTALLFCHLPFFLSLSLPFPSLHPSFNMSLCFTFSRAKLNPAHLQNSPGSLFASD